MNLRIKGKFFFSFIVLCFFSFLFTVVSIWMYNKKDKVSHQIKMMNEIHLLSMEQYKQQQEFLLFESSNPLFFENKHCTAIVLHQKLSKKITTILKSFYYNNEAKQLFAARDVQYILFRQNQYQNNFDTLVSLIKQRGYKDFGIEGQMRNYAHALMNIKDLNQINILMLRRHEKDFIIRKDIKYLKDFNEVIRLVKIEIINNHNLSSLQKLELDSIINGYSTTFSRLVSTEMYLVGENTNTGLIHQLSKEHNYIVTSITAMKRDAANMEKELYDDLLLIAVVITLLVFVLALVFSYKLASQLAKPITNLNTYISKYVDSKFSVIPLLEQTKNKDEVSELGNNFATMIEEITSHIKYFEEKVAERTKEVHKQNNEIFRQSNKINDQYEELVIKNEVLVIQQKRIVESHKNITDSIKYAERIQKAIMPPKAVINKILQQGFIYFQPRDIVSGDFYFLVELNNKIFFAVADCTGHGVPGAFLSIIGIHAIHRALNEYYLEKPSEILNRVNKLLEQNISNHDESILRDGMDIAICCYDKNTNTLEYSGANMPIWIVSKLDEEEEEGFNDLTIAANIVNTTNGYFVKEIKADKQPIGYYDKRLPFNNHILEVKKGDMVYIFSDGYADQFGGPDGKKYKYKQLREMLIAIQVHNIDVQKQIIKETFLDWKGRLEQVDDICVIAFKV